MQTIDPLVLSSVTGGTQYPNMGAPKYSAAWWDLVRARGLDGGRPAAPVTAPR